MGLRKIIKKIDEDIRGDFERCAKIALRLSMQFPEVANIWTGTVSERLDRGVSLLIEENQRFKNQRSRLKCIQRSIVSDEDIERVHANANFGEMDKRDVVNQGVLKCASGYQQGSTSMRIIKEHGLVNDKYELTDKGRKYLWATFGDGIF